MHDHLCRSVFLAQPRGRVDWVESVIGPEVEITVDWVNQAIDAAVDFGPRCSSSPELDFQCQLLLARLKHTNRMPSDLSK